MATTLLAASRGTTDDNLKAHFEAAGTVLSARVVTDRESGRSRGFGFVEWKMMTTQKVIDTLNSSQLDGREITVNEARPREENHVTS